MKIAKIERKETTLVLLEVSEGDFLIEELEPNHFAPTLKSLSSKKLNEIAFKLGFLGWEWVGHYNEETQTIQVKFYKHLFV